ncbi:hypothetical protein FE257_003667 [Aspergillus nanangensis]|uniref:Rhodopsin domain-containing protein n=1 Tax=Aspergillus nanangensis TaxID=2582783 RepID=A0AAD4GWG4_ASPNN|nr:hypothetical protein FE257_003667 [Aspergillus nanangensis]
MADRSASITGVSWSFGAISTILVALRLYTRILVTHRAGWDDFFISLSLASALVCSALAEVAVHYGLGMHMNDIADLDSRTQAVKYTVIAPNFSVVSTTTGKISVAILLLRLMGQSATWPRRWFLYILTVISIVWNTLAVIVIIGFCRPAKKIWLPETPGSCFSLRMQLIIGTSQAAFNAVADLSLAVFPVLIFWKVQLAFVKKMAIIGILGAGIFATAATLVKCILLKNLPQHADITWSWAPITTWYTIEMYVIIICATIPTLPRSYLTILQWSTHHSASYRKSKSGNSEPNEPPIRLQRRPVDASLFETYVEEGDSNNSNSSQENILRGNAPGSRGIHMTTEVRIFEETRPGNAHQNPHFPRENPFRGSNEVSPK